MRWTVLRSSRSKTRDTTRSVRIAKYVVTARADLKSADGQTLGYPWLGIVDNWHFRAFTSFGDGHGVWEKDGGTTLPFYSRNLQNVTQWAARLQPIRVDADAPAASGEGFQADTAGGAAEPSEAGRHAGP